MTHGASIHPSGAVAGARAPAARVPLREKVFTTPLIGISVYLFVIHSYKLDIAGPAILVALLGLFAEGRRLRVPNFLGWFGVWLAWSLLTYTWSSYRAEVWEAWVEFLKVWLIIFVMVNAIRTPRQLLAFAITWLAMFALFPVRGTLFNIMFGYATAGRYAWNFAFENPNEMAAYTLLLLALSVAVLRIAPAKWVRLCALTGIFVLPVIIFFTQSRGGLLGLALFGLLVFAGERGKLKILLIGAAAAVVVVATAPDSVWERIKGMKNLTSTDTLAEADVSAEQRWTIWEIAGGIIAKHPVGGVGLGAYPRENAIAVRALGGRSGEFGLAGGQRDAHSAYITVLAETGFVGVLFFLTMLWSALGAGRRAERLLKRLGDAKSDLEALVALRAGLLGFMVCAGFGGLHREPYLYFMMGLIVHYSAMLREVQRTNPSPVTLGRAAPRVARDLA